LVTGIVLAGGKSSRLGQDKAFVRLGGRSMLERITEVLSQVFDRIIIVTCTTLKHPRPGITVIQDIIPGCGPLGGIYTGLKRSPSQYSFITACDLPFIRPSLINYMLEGLKDYDVIVPRVGERLEPLHAIYSKNCIAHIEKQLHAGPFKVTGFFPRVKVREISREEIERFDPGMLSFFNINTPSDLEKARRMLERQSR